jgi:hypothetical protein
LEVLHLRLPQPVNKQGDNRDSSSQMAIEGAITTPRVPNPCHGISPAQFCGPHRAFLQQIDEATTLKDALIDWISLVRCCVPLA